SGETSVNHSVTRSGSVRADHAVSRSAGVSIDSWMGAGFTCAAIGVRASVVVRAGQEVAAAADELALPLVHLGTAVGAGQDDGGRVGVVGGCGPRAGGSRGRWLLDVEQRNRRHVDA